MQRDDILQLIKEIETRIKQDTGIDIKKPSPREAQFLELYHRRDMNKYLKFCAMI